MTLEQFITRLLNRPLLLDRSYARQLFSSLSGKLNIASVSDGQDDLPLGEKLRVRSMAGMQGDSAERYRPYRIVDAIAVIPVTGTLLHRYPWIDSWATGYDAIVHVVQLAVEDPEVEGVLLDIDSPGGEVAGCFDAAKQLRSLGEIKPIASLCNDMTLSAAMCLASAAEHRYITTTGEAGSVGVAMVHWSYEDMLKNDGVEVTLIYSGEHKVEGNRYQNLPEGVYNRFKNECQSIHKEFAAIVADHTSMSADAVLATEAAIYRGQAAIDVGFASELVNSHAAIAAFRNYLSPGDGPPSEGTSMSNDKGKAAAKPRENAASSAGDKEHNNPAGGEGEPSGEASAKAERTRIQGITNCEAAAGREKLAEHFAFETDMSVEQAEKALSAAPIESVSGDGGDGGDALGRAMQAHKNSGIGADGNQGDGGDGGDTTAKTIERIAGGYNQMTGRGKR